MRYLDDENLNISYIGKKAFNLNKLKTAGLQVPNGFMLSMLENVRSKRSEIEAAIVKIGGFPVAVRSSGSLEDLSGASFAGMYESYLFINSIEDLLEKIELCFKSTESERVKKYLKEKKLESKLEFSCLVQKMIDAQYAGVTFTLNPVSGKEEELLFEIVQGVGDKLVSGECTPNQYIYNKKNKIVTTIHQEFEFEIKNKFINDLIKTSNEITKIFGAPQDIEWAVDKSGNLHILQSRPITSIQYRKDYQEMTNADLKDGGISARVCTPMMYSLYEKCFELSMSEYFEKIKLKDKKTKIKWMHYLYGRGYWSAHEVKKLLFKIPGFSEKTFDEDLGIRKNYGPKGPMIVKNSVSVIIKILPTAFALEKEYKNCQKMLDGFKAWFEKIDFEEKEKIQKISKLSTSELLMQFQNTIENYYLKTETSYYRTIYNNSNYQSDFKSFIRKLSFTIDILKLFSGISTIPHMQVQSDFLILAKIAKQDGIESKEFIKGLETFLEKHYHHGDAELELKTPRWGEVPQRVIDLTKKLMESPNAPLDPLKTCEIQFQEYENYKNEISKQLNFIKKTSFLNKLQTARFFLSYRESMREYSTRSYFIIRQYLLEIAKRFKEEKIILEEDEIFLFKIDELLEFCKTKENKITREEIENKKYDYEGFRNFSAPDDFGFDLSEILETDGGLKGIPCSKGKVTAIARVVKDINEIENITEGCILVTKFTDPAWTPVFSLVKGVVTEVGGILSHAAVISREYGIPAILNVKDVTQTIKDGDLITIDGETGQIIIHQK